VTLTFSHPDTWPGEDGEVRQVAVLIGAAAGGILFIIVLILTLCCVCRRRGKDKTGHTHNGSLLAYADPAGEKLLANQGTLPRTNPLPKPPRQGEYGILPQTEHELAEYGPASYVPGDRYDEYGEGRTSASNSDQTGTLSRASYHSSDPEQYPDLLDIPNRFKQASPTSICTAPLPPIPYHTLQQHHQQPLHPAHLISPPSHHHHHHHPSPFTRTGTLPHNYTMGTLPHQPRSVSCDHSAYGPVNGNRPGYVTLPRRPRQSWAGVQAGTLPRDSPSPAPSTFRHDPIYDGVGPRTSADGSSKLSLNRSQDNGGVVTPRGAAGIPNGRVPVNGIPNGRVPVNGTVLPPYIPAIDEAPEINKTVRINSPPNMGESSSGLSKRSPITTSQQTLVEENLAAYCEPWGAALPPTPGNRDSIASADSDGMPELKDKQAPETVAPVMCSTPKSSAEAASSSPPPATPLQTIHEADTPTHAPAKVPPPTLPKPKNRPLPPPKPKKSVDNNNKVDANGTGEIFQDETIDGSEV